jgi:beta-xylosidase
MKSARLDPESGSCPGSAARPVITRASVIIGIVTIGMLLTTSAADLWKQHTDKPPTSLGPIVGPPQLIARTDVPDPAVVWDGTVGHHRYVVFSTQSSPSSFIPEYTITESRGGWSSLLPAGGLTRVDAGSWIASDAIGTAPGVIQLVDGSWTLYFDAHPSGGPEGDNCIGMATAPTSTGPWSAASVLHGYPLWGEDGSASNGDGGHFPTNDAATIDPQPFRDASGQLWLLWKANDFSGNHCSIGSIRLDPTGTVVQSAPVTLLTPSQGWQSAGQLVVEAPDMIYRNGTYYIFFSGGYWGTDAYGEGGAICPGGPAARRTGGYDASPILRTGTINGQTVIGPGGGCVFEDSAGRLWMAFHGWSGTDKLTFPYSYYWGNQVRQLYFARLKL